MKNLNLQKLFKLYNVDFIFDSKNNILYWKKNDKEILSTSNNNLTLFKHFEEFFTYNETIIPNSYQYINLFYQNVKTKYSLIIDDLTIINIQNGGLYIL